MKTTLLYLLLMFLGLSSMGQSFMQSTGATISIMTAKLTNRGTTASYTISHTDFTYFPRFNVIQSESSSLSVGVPVSVGVSIAKNPSTDEAGIYWGFDVPLVLDYNIGAKSTAENEDAFGGYIGAGFGYTYTSIDFGDDSDNKATSYGPLGRLGMRLGFPDSETGQGITVGAFYKIGLEKEKFKTIGFNVLLDF